MLSDNLYIRLSEVAVYGKGDESKIKIKLLNKNHAGKDR